MRSAIKKSTALAQSLAEVKSERRGKKRQKGDYLTPLSGKPKRRPFIVLDLESKHDDTQRAGFTRPFMAGIDDGEEYTPFFDTNKGEHWEERWWREGGCVDQMMHRILSKKYRGHHIYAHNGGRFDFLFILTWLILRGHKFGWSFEVIPVASSIQVLDVWRGQRRHERWRFLDSYRLVPTSLDKAAKSMGLGGKVDDFDLNTPENHPDWVVYNERDCRQLYRVLERFHDYVENILLGEVGITAPATSMKLFRRKYLPAPLPRHKEFHEFIREGYYGGRVESLVKRGSDCRYFDINSSYPAAMLEPMPGGSAIAWKGEPTSQLIKHRIGFVRADVYVPEDTRLPVLPVKVDGKLLFPVGKLSGVWMWDELMLAVEEGAVVERYYESVWYEKVQMFGTKDSGFVHDLYRLRQRCDYCSSAKFGEHEQQCPECGFDRGLADVAKILLNSGYGKFGMKTLRKKLYKWNDPELPTNATPADGTPDSLLWYAEQEVDAPYIMPQVSACVTAHARMRLYRYMREALDKGGEVFYVDTDSIITNVVLETSIELGALKDEYPGVTFEGRFYGPKMYALESPKLVKVKVKGVEFGRPDKELMKTDAKRAMYEHERRKLEIVERLDRGETFTMQRLEKLGSLARKGFQSGPKMVSVPRRFLKDDAGNPMNSKRVFHEDGTSSPRRVDMWGESEAVA